MQKLEQNTHSALMSTHASFGTDQALYFKCNLYTSQLMKQGWFWVRYTQNK